MYFTAKNQIEISKNKSYKISEKNVLSGGFLSRGVFVCGVFVLEPSKVANFVKRNQNDILILLKISKMVHCKIDSVAHLCTKISYTYMYASPGSL